MGGYAWVTLATNDAYSLGALVLAHSLRRVGTKYELAVLVTPGVTQTMREKLAAVYSLVREVNVLDSKDEANLALLARPELGITFTKLHCWRLTQYDKCVFLDADTLVVRNCDELFEREELSAAPDVGWPDCFNSGVFVFKPSQQTFASITAFAAAKGSFDGGDQGLLNMYFNDWAHKDISKHLPFIYNMCSTATYSYLPAFKQFGEDVRIIHFIGMTKPWLQYVDTVTGTVQPAPGSSHLQPLLQLWWNVFFENVHRQLSPTMATSTLAPIWHEYIPLPFKSSIPKSPLFPDLDNKGHSAVYSKTVDFSEFKDPWEDYSIENDTYFNSECTSQDRICSCTANIEHSFQTVHKECHSLTLPIYEKYCEPPFTDQNEFQREKHSNQIHTTTSHSTEHQYTHEYMKPKTVINPQEQIFFCAKHSYNEKYFVDQSTSTPHWDEQNVNYYQQHNEQNSNQFHTKPHNTHNHCENTSQHTLTYEHSKNSASQANNTKHNESIQRNDTDEHKWSNTDSQKTNITNCNIHVSHHEEENQQNYQQHREHYQCNEVTTPDKFTNACIQITESNLMLHEHREFNKKCSIQDKGMDRQTNIQRLKSHPDPEPCTDLHNVGTQSDLNMTERLDSSNAGLAGALAQMTLGEPRSAEQIAFEEHMRKQSWEQGQIDYMGRDSFDNIWKKICETLSFAPERLPSPPKETAPPAESMEEKTIPTTDIEVDDPTAEVISKRIGEQLIFGTPVDEASVQKECTGGKSTAPSAHLLESAPPEVPNEEKDVVDAMINPLDKMKQISVVTDPGPSAAEVTTEKGLTVSQVLDLQHANVESPLETSPLTVSTEVTTRAPLSSLPKEEISQETIPSALLCEIRDCPSTVLKDPAPPQLASTPVDTQDIISKSPVTTAKVESCIEVGNLVAPIVAVAHQETLLTEGRSMDMTTKQPQEPLTEETAVTSCIAVLPEASKPITETGTTVIIESKTKTEPNVGQHEQHANVLSTASEISTVSPVPIQVAESVLQAEPKESILDNSKPMVTSVISSTVTPIHEATALPSEGLTRQDEKLQLNGSASIAVHEESKEKLDNRERMAVVKEDVSAEKSIDLRTSELASLESALPKPETQSTCGITAVLSQETDVGSLETSRLEEDSRKRVESKEHAEKTDVTPIKGTELQKLDLSMSEVSQPPLSEESPVRPMRTKEFSIPSTPVVTEATPPTSPPITTQQELESEAKASKKSSKKAAQKPAQEVESAEDGDGAEKKLGKKVGKKVIKKVKSKSEESFEEGADNSNVSKVKKTAKVVKKGTKPPQTLGTDTSVPETPPPGSSDAPVPPKRKVKPAPGKAEEKPRKKSDAE